MKRIDFILSKVAAEKLYWLLGYFVVFALGWCSGGISAGIASLIGNGFILLFPFFGISWFIWNNSWFFGNEDSNTNIMKIGMFVGCFFTVIYLKTSIHPYILEKCDAISVYVRIAYFIFLTNIPLVFGIVFSDYSRRKINNKKIHRFDYMNKYDSLALEIDVIGLVTHENELSHRVDLKNEWMRQYKEYFDKNDEIFGSNYELYGILKKGESFKTQYENQCASEINIGSSNPTIVNWYKYIYQWKNYFAKNSFFDFYLSFYQKYWYPEYNRLEQLIRQKEELYKRHKAHLGGIGAGLDGERMVEDVVRPFDYEIQILPNITLEAEINRRKKTAENDLILIAPQGVFSIEIKNKWRNCSVIEIGCDGTWYTIGRDRKRTVLEGDPSEQTNWHLAILLKVLKENFGSREFNVNGVVVIANKKAQIKNESLQKIVRPNELINVIRSYPPILSEIEINEMKRVLERCSVESKKYSVPNYCKEMEDLFRKIEKSKLKLCALRDFINPYISEMSKL